MAKTLLLADDSVTIQKVVGISFANEDVTLITVDNGDDAVSRAREVRPDVVLADVVMPGKSGYEVCEEIKSDPDLRGTPVLLLTGTFEAFDEDRARAAGADGHITKPFEAQSLVDQVNELFRSGPTAAPSVPVAPDPEPAADDAFDFLGDAGEDSEVHVTAEPGDSIGLDTATEDDAFSFATPDDLAADSPPPSAAADHTIAILPDEEPDFEIAADEDPLAESADSDAGASAFEFEFGEPGEPLADDPLAVSGEVEIGEAAAIAGSPLEDEPDSDDGAPIGVVSEDPLGTSDPDLGEGELLTDEPIEQLEPLAEPEPAPAAAPASALAEAVAAANLPPEIGERIHATLEKVAWEAFGELTETLVRQALERVEAVAWEVIPRMAETLIQEEIDRLKAGSDDS